MLDPETRGPAAYDVVIVGGGPVGQLLACMLGEQGWRVGVFERWPSRYPDPRACGLGHEPMRILQSAGLMESLSPKLDFVIGADRVYEFRNAQKEVLLRVTWSGGGESGWPEMATFFQPDLEDVLEQRLETMPNVDFQHGWEAVSVEQGAASARVGLRRQGAEGAAERFAEGAYVIGADGANSIVRGAMDVQMHDLGFDFDWLVVDTIPHEQRVWSPYLEQRCDPARPTTCVPSGPGRRRWEFMRLPHESKAELNTEATAWRLLEPWGLTPANATLVRHAVYTFNGRWADRWREGRLILAGDSAHLMPPFLGQGLGSGFRDAIAVAWRLRLILSGRASDALLDSYTPERVGHVKQIINDAVQLGRIICVEDPTAAAERDRQMLAARDEPSLAPPPPLPWRLAYSDLLCADDPSSGLLGMQATVRQGDDTGFLDDVVGGGFMLMSPSADPAAALSPEALSFWRSIGGKSAHVSATGPVVDVDGAYARWFEKLGADLVLVRPDFYVFAAAPSAAAADSLVRRLAAAMQIGLPAHSPSMGK